MTKTLHKVLLSPLFLIGLIILLINDFFLKSYFHNYLTGKLSDFAGLFVFALFWSALFPRSKAVIFSCIVVFFSFWKSPLASGFIDWWNSIGIFTIARTVDYTDLSAFVVLPAAWIYGENCRAFRVPVFSQNYALTVIALVSVFAFTATSQPEPNSHYLEYQENYTVEKSSLEVLKKLQEYETDYFYESRGQNKNLTSMSIKFRSKFCDDKPSAGFEISGQGNRSTIKLTSVNYTCQTVNLENQEKLKRIFEAEVVDFLKN